MPENPVELTEDIASWQAGSLDFKAELGKLLWDGALSQLVLDRCSRGTGSSTLFGRWGEGTALCRGLRRRRRADSLEKTLVLGKTGAGGEGDDRGWDGWMASPTQWTWVWVGSRSWWWTGRPGVLRFLGSQRVGHDWETELNWTAEEAQPPRKHFSSEDLKLFLKWQE